MIKILMQTGTLEWDLSERVIHHAGGVLQVTLRIANPTAVSRLYQVYMALFDPTTGSVIDGTSGPISVEGVNSFEVDRDSEQTVVAPLKIDYSNVLLQAALYDVQSGEMAVGLQALLELPSGVGGQIEPVTGFASGVMALGMVTGMVTDMITNMGG